MSTGLIITVVVIGAVLVAGAITWLVVWINRSNAAKNAAALERLATEARQRGWTFAARDDSVAELYSQQQAQFTPRSPMHPLLRPPRASAAHDVITGTHRGRPFLAAVLDTQYEGNHTPECCIWVCTPTARPLLTVHKVAKLESSVNNAIGMGDIRFGSPRFDELFDVQSEDDRFAAAAISPALIEFLLTDPRRFRGFTLFANHVDVLDPVSDHRDPAELVPALDLRCDILDRIPNAVWA